MNAAHYQYSALFTCLLNLFLVIFVFLKGDRKRLVQCFLLYGTSIVLWSLSVFMTVSSKDEKSAYIFSQTTHIGAALIPVFFLQFVYEFLGIRKRRFVLKIFYLGTLFFITVIIVTPSLFFGNPGVSPKLSFNYFPNVGILYTPWVIEFATITILAHLMLLWSWLHEKNYFRKNQIRFFFFANLIGYSGGIGCFLPVYGTNIFPFPFGAYGVAFFSVVTAYAVLVYKFIDIEIILKRTLIFGGIVVISVCAIALPLMLLQFFIGRVIGIPPFGFVVLGAMTATLIYRPIARKLVDLTDKFLFQKKFDFAKVLKETSKDIALVTSLKELTRRIMVVLARRARLKSASLYVRSPNNEHFELRGRYGYGHKNRPDELLNVQSTLITFISQRQSPVTKSSIEDELKSSNSESDRTQLRTVMDTMFKLKAEIIVPSFLSGAPTLSKSSRTFMTLRGMLVLGGKKSDEDYYEQDIDMLATLAQEYAIAFENARLYDESINKQLELERTNNELEKAQSQLLRAVEDLEESNKKKTQAMEEALTAKKQAEQAKEEESLAKEEALAAKEDERKAKEEALAAKKKSEEMEVELIRRQNLVFVERLVQGLAHEIYNPMGTILVQIGMIEIYLKEFRKYYHETLPHASEDRKRFVERVFDDYRHSISLLRSTTNHIQHLLDTLNEMQKKDDQSIKPIDFKGYWAGATAVVEAQSHGIVLEEVKIDARIQKDLSRVRANTVQLTQVFINLYRNALYAVKDCEKKKISLDAKEDLDNKDFLRIDFVDNGTGISPDALPKVFDFGYSTKGEKGQGIGLNMCKVIIERFGGTLTCESELGMGTRFIIRLQFVKEESAVEDVNDEFSA